eukprot:scaffold31921_cov73-Isochrysis_galbana.AAC.1
MDSPPHTHTQARLPLSPPAGGARPGVRAGEGAHGAAPGAQPARHCLRLELGSPSDEPEAAAHHSHHPPRIPQAVRAPPPQSAAR